MATCMAPRVRKLTYVVIIHMLTMPSTTTLVLANMSAPTRPISSISVLTDEQYRKRHHQPSGMAAKWLPGPKFCTMPSTQPVMASAAPTRLARKNSVPMEPPNSAPSVRLIMTGCVCGNEQGY